VHVLLKGFFLSKRNEFSDPEEEVVIEAVGSEVGGEGSGRRLSLEKRDLNRSLSLVHEEMLMKLRKDLQIIHLN